MNNALAQSRQQARTNRMLAGAAARHEAVPAAWDDDARIEKQTEHETDLVLSDHSYYDELIESASDRADLTDAIHGVVNDIVPRLNKPLSMSEHNDLNADMHFAMQKSARPWRISPASKSKPRSPGGIAMSTTNRFYNDHYIPSWADSRAAFAARQAERRVNAQGLTVKQILDWAKTREQNNGK